MTLAELDTLEVLPETPPRVVGAEPSSAAPDRSQPRWRATTHATTPSTRWERWGVWLAAASLYLVTAYILSSHRVLSGDAMSRTLSASNTIVGRDPHLESIGFIWPPFPAMFQIPLTALSNWFPSLVSHGFAGTIVSALLMATMVAGVRRWLEESGVSVLARIGLVALLAVHPFLLLYAGNGMSEASMLCFLVIAANRLARWWERETALDLIVAGMALSMAYLSRYEVGLAIVLVTAAVGVEGARRATGDPKSRYRRGVVCATSAGFIPFSAIGVWALWSWSTIGEPFAQFTSQYGNSAIVAGAGAAAGTSRLVLFLTQAVIFGGAVLGLVAATVWFGTRGFARVAALILVVLSPLAFNLLAAYNGTTFAFARFTITLVPATVMFLGPLLAGFASDLNRSRVFVWGASAVAIGSCIAVAIAGLPVMWQGKYGTADEAVQLTVMPGPYRNNRPIKTKPVIESMRAIAADIDRLNLADSTVLTDDFSSFLIVASSAHRKQFITTPDRDFERVLSAPRIFGVKYLLVPDNDNPYYDAIRDVYPGVFQGTNAIASVAWEWGNDSSPGSHYRLLRLKQKDKSAS